MEIANTTHRLQLPMLTLSMASFLYTFITDGLRPLLTIQGTLFPRLKFATSPLKITYVPSHGIIRVPTQLPITWIQARKLRKILKQQHVVIFFLWEKQAFDLLPVKVETEMQIAI
jgi:hypothetical protein